MFEMNGLDIWIENFKRIKVEFPQEIQKEVYRLANKLLRKVKQKTPVGQYKDGKQGGDLRRNWRIGDLVIESGNCYIEVFNDLHYAPDVEFGHRTRLGVTKNPSKYKQRGSIAYVPGTHMLKISVEELNANLTSELQAWMSRILGDLF